MLDVERNSNTILARFLILVTPSLTGMAGEEAEILGIFEKSMQIDTDLDKDLRRTVYRCACASQL